MFFSCSRAKVGKFLPNVFSIKSMCKQARPLNHECFAYDLTA